MIPNFCLCRFRASHGETHLGLVAGGQVYDLTAQGRAEYASLEAWLKSAGGRVEGALAALRVVPDDARPICSAEALLSPEQDPKVLAPLDTQEVWACGVTYEMSREARMRESGGPPSMGECTTHRARRSLSRPRLTASWGLTRRWASGLTQAGVCPSQRWSWW